MNDEISVEEAQEKLDQFGANTTLNTLKFENQELKNFIKDSEIPIKKFLNDEISYKEAEQEVKQLGTNETFFEELAADLKERNSSIDTMSLDKVLAEKEKYKIEKTKARDATNGIIEDGTKMKNKLVRFGEKSWEVIKTIFTITIKAAIFIVNTFIGLALSIVIGILYFIIAIGVFTYEYAKEAITQ